MAVEVYSYLTVRGWGNLVTWFSYQGGPWFCGLFCLVFHFSTQLSVGIGEAVPTAIQSFHWLLKHLCNIDTFILLLGHGKLPEFNAV